MNGYPGKRARVFVASSSGTVGVAEALKNCLSDNETIVVPWKELGVFLLSEHAIESLEKAASQCQFAVFVLGQDDILKQEDGETYVPRDNVVFELGLFLGRIGRKRSYMLTPKGVKIRLPTDLSGINWAEFQQPGTRPEDVRDAAAQIRLAMMQAPMTLTEQVLSATVLPPIVFRHCLGILQKGSSRILGLFRRRRFFCDAQITVCTSEGRIIRHPRVSSLGQNVATHEGKVLWSTFQHKPTDRPFEIMLREKNQTGWVVWADSGYSQLYTPISGRHNHRICAGCSRWESGKVRILEIHQELAAELDENALQQIGQTLGARIIEVISE